MAPLPGDGCKDGLRRLDEWVTDHRPKDPDWPRGLEAGLDGGQCPELCEVGSGSSHHLGCLDQMVWQWSTHPGSGVWPLVAEGHHGSAQFTKGGCQKTAAVQRECPHGQRGGCVKTVHTLALFSFHGPWGTYQHDCSLWLPATCSRCKRCMGGVSAAWALRTFNYY